MQQTVTFAIKLSRAIVMENLRTCQLLRIETRENNPPLHVLHAEHNTRCKILKRRGPDHGISDAI